MSYPREDHYTNTEADAGDYDRRHFAEEPDRPGRSDLAEPDDDGRCYYCGKPGCHGGKTCAR